MPAASKQHLKALLRHKRQTLASQLSGLRKQPRCRPAAAADEVAGVVARAWQDRSVAPAGCGPVDGDDSISDVTIPEGPGNSDIDTISDDSADGSDCDDVAPIASRRGPRPPSTAAPCSFRSPGPLAGPAAAPAVSTCLRAPATAAPSPPSCGVPLASTVTADALPAMSRPLRFATRPSPLLHSGARDSFSEQRLWTSTVAASAAAPATLSLPRPPATSPMPPPLGDGGSFPEQQLQRSSGSLFANATAAAPGSSRKRPMSPKSDPPMAKARPGPPQPQPKVRMRGSVVLSGPGRSAAKASFRPAAPKTPPILEPMLSLPEAQPPVRLPLPDPKPAPPEAKAMPKQPKAKPKPRPAALVRMRGSVARAPVLKTISQRKQQLPRPVDDCEPAAALKKALLRLQQRRHRDRRAAEARPHAEPNFGTVVPDSTVVTQPEIPQLFRKRVCLTRRSLGDDLSGGGSAASALGGPAIPPWRADRGMGALVLDSRSGTRRSLKKAREILTAASKRRRLSGEGQGSTEEEWARCCTIQVNASGDQGTLELDMSGQGLTDAAATRWSKWMCKQMQARDVNWQVNLLDFSKNQLGGNGISEVLSVLEHFGARCKVFRFGDNLIDDDALWTITQHVTSIQAPIDALYIADNKITIRGLFWLLAAIASHPTFPIEHRSGGSSKFIPVWLQMEGNELSQEELQNFFRHSSFRDLGCSLCLATHPDCDHLGNCRHACSQGATKHNMVAHLSVGWSGPEPCEAARICCNAHQVFRSALSSVSRDTWLEHRASAQRNEPEVLYEDVQFFVMLKPAGWHCGNERHAPGLVKRARKCTSAERRTLAQELLAKEEPQAFHDYLILRFGGQEGGSRAASILKQAYLYGMVHRLDVGTSGPLLVARTLESWSWAKDQIFSQSMLRDYVALVHGTFSPDKQRDVIEARINKCGYERDRRVQIDNKKGMTARTIYEKLAVYQDPVGSAKYTLVHFRLITGRTHQIRVHMEHAGHPLVGDKQYFRGLDPRERKESQRLCKRAFLHKVRFVFATYPQANSVIFLQHILCKFDQLRVLSLNFSDCDQLCDLSPLAEGMRTLGALQSLDLDLTGCQHLVNMTPIGAALGHVKKKLQHLSLCIRSCPQVKNADFLGEDFGKLFQLRKLSLNFSDCTQFTDVSQVGNGLANLFRIQDLNLDFTNCSQLAEIGSLEKGIGQQQELVTFAWSLSSCMKVKDLSALAALLQCTGVRSLTLDLQGCMQAADLARLVGHAIAALEQLQHLGLKLGGCSQIAEIAKMSKYLSNLFQLETLTVDFLDCAKLVDVSSLGHGLGSLKRTQPNPRNKEMPPPGAVSRFLGWLVSACVATEPFPLLQRLLATGRGAHAGQGAPVLPEVAAPELELRWLDTVDGRAGRGLSAAASQAAGTSRAQLPVLLEPYGHQAFGHDGPLHSSEESQDEFQRLFALERRELAGECVQELGGPRGAEPGFEGLLAGSQHDDPGYWGPTTQEAAHPEPKLLRLLRANGGQVSHYRGRQAGRAAAFDPELRELLATSRGGRRGHAEGENPTAQVSVPEAPAC
eukprot:TRINITY_DN11463_c0_g1_i1.p1 TRINITY_DN11463_c0_g1~~TRINITY_DN11463_c0_g1_i1.p1  ORF type:complete len:1551 (-),score=277.81 TRINITY_DN11463_c0_g1_i1:381-5033(-)